MFCFSNDSKKKKKNVVALETFFSLINKKIKAFLTCDVHV